MQAAALLLATALSLGTASASAAFDAHGRETLRFGGTAQEMLSDRHGGLLLFINDYGRGPGIVRLKANGSIDRRFGRGGFVDIGWSDAAVQRDGRILVLSSVVPPNELVETKMTVFRLRRNGRLDRSFGDGGSATVGLGGPLELPGAIAPAPRGKVLIGGSSATYYEPRGGSDEVAVVVRLKRDGRLDRTFSRDGRTALRGAVQVAALADDPRRGILVADNAGLPMLWRIRQGGAVDRSFGEGGALRVGLSDSLAEYVYFSPLRHIGLLPGGRFVLVGTTSDDQLGRGNFSAAAVRYLPDGRRDGAFGVDGRASFAFRGLDYTFPVAFALGRRGRLLIAAGLIDPLPDNHRFGAISLRPNGTRDRRFGRGGEVRAGFPGDGWATAIAFAPRSRVVLAGFSQPGVENLTSLARFPLVRRR